MLDLSETSAHEVASWLQGREMAWDVGANTGMTLPLLTELFSKVIAFEPAAESFAPLAAAWGQDPQVQLVNKAVAGRDGKLVLSVRTAPMFSGQLVAPDMDWDWGPETGRRYVPCVTLDSLTIEHGVPDFVKIDTEGGELKVLQGASRLIAMRKTCWWTEFHAVDQRDECEKIFRDAGYDTDIGRPSRFPEDSHEWQAYGWMKAVPNANH